MPIRKTTLFCFIANVNGISCRILLCAYLLREATNLCRMFAKASNQLVLSASRVRGASVRCVSALSSATFSVNKIEQMRFPRARYE